MTPKRGAEADESRHGSKPIEIPTDSEWKRSFLEIRSAKASPVLSSREKSGEESREESLVGLFQEMSVPLTPLTAIAQTPRKEQESKFSFNPHLAKVGIDRFTHSAAN